jgi:hypothetical protein
MKACQAREVLSRDLREVLALGPARPTTLYRGGWDLSGSAVPLYRHRARNPRTTDHHLERLGRSLPGLSTCRTRLGRDHRRSPDRLSVHAEGRTGAAALARNPSALRRGYSAHEPGFSPNVARRHATDRSDGEVSQAGLCGLSKKYQGKVRGNPEDTKSSGPSSGPIRRRSTPTIRVMPRRRFGKRSAVIRSSSRRGWRSALRQAVCHWTHGLAALVVLEFHQADTCRRINPVPSAAVGASSGSGGLLNAIGDVSAAAATPHLPKRPCASSAARE